MSQNYYDILNVKKNATSEEIKKSYRKLSMKHHPDRGGKKEIFQKINDAYQTLGDDQKRKVYDMQQNMGGRNHPFGNASNIDPNDFIRSMFGQNFPFPGMNMNGMGPNIRIFRNGQQVNFNIPKKPTPIIKNIKITMENAFNGVNLPLEIERYVIEENNKKLEREKIYIEIKPGIDNNEIIMIKDKGNQNANGIKGDVKIFIVIENKSQFIRDGLNIIYKKNISLKEALTGFHFEIKHLSGKTYVINNQDGKVIQPGYKKIIPHLGFKRERSHPAPPMIGNLIIIFDVVFPVDLSEEQQNKLKDIL